MRTKELIIAAAPREFVDPYLSAISDWDGRVLLVNRASEDRYAVPHVRVWGDGFISLKTWGLWGALLFLRPRLVTVLTNPVLDDSNILNCVKRINKVALNKCKVVTLRPKSLLQEFVEASQQFILPESMHALAGFYRGLSKVHMLRKLISRGLEAASPKRRWRGGQGLKEEYSTSIIEDRVVFQANIENLEVSRKITSKEIYIGQTKATSLTPQRHKHKPKIVLLGASHLMGRLLPNEDSLGWLLQERFQDYNVVCHAVGGVSTLQQFPILRKYIAEEENICSVVSFATPCLDSKVLCKPFPGLMPRLSVLRKEQPVLPDETRGLSQVFRFWESRPVEELTAKAISSMYRHCLDNGVNFLSAVAGWRASLIYPYLINSGTPWVPCTVGPDGELMHRHMDRWSLWPTIRTPNARAHKWFARQVGNALQAQLLGEPLQMHRHLLNGKLVDEPLQAKVLQDDVYPLF